MKTIYHVQFITFLVSSSSLFYEFMADFVVFWQVLIWNMETFDFVKTSEGHSLLITDVRFQPNSTVFATSSFDKTVKIWDASNVSFFHSH